MQALAREVPVASSVRAYAARLVLATHPDRENAPKGVKRFVRHGASPRAAQALVLCGKVHALLAGRMHVGPSDVRASPQVAAREDSRVTDPDASPSPFRRFPWVQLVFCLACLTMAGYTWMRFSYAWEVTPEDLLAAASGGVSPERTTGLYVRLTPSRESEWCEWAESMFDPDSTSLVYTPGIKRSVRVTPEKIRALPANSVEDYDMESYADTFLVSFSPPTRKFELIRRGIPGRVRGRSEGWGGYPAWTVDTTASRFHPASIAGLVVGAMGCFIFGLYLRAWLQEGKALAGEQRQHQPANNDSSSDEPMAKND